MEAETADLVTFASNMVVDGDRSGCAIAGDESASHIDQECANRTGHECSAADSREYCGDNTHAEVRLGANKSGKLQRSDMKR